MRRRFGRPARQLRLSAAEDEKEEEEEGGRRSKLFMQKHGQADAQQKEAHLEDRARMEPRMEEEEGRVTLLWLLMKMT